MRNRFFQLAALVLFLAGCAETVTRNNSSRILTMGDSLLSTHSISGRAVSNSIEAALGEQVVDRSVMGASILYALPISGALGLNIGKQFTTGDWDWVVLNGGGNDLWLGCGCNQCERKMSRLISGDGSHGEIPRLVSKLRKTGAHVIYVGYLRSPGVGSPIESCKDEGDELERRIDAMATSDDGVHFLSLADMVPYGDRSYHGVDMIHPSLKASSEIGQRVADIIGQ